MKRLISCKQHENDEDADYEHLEHGDDFGSPHETWISNHFGCANICRELPSSYQGLLHETSSWKSLERVFVQTCLLQKAMEKSSVALCVRKTTMPLLQNG